MLRHLFGKCGKIQMSPWWTYFYSPIESNAILTLYPIIFYSEKCAFRQMREKVDVLLPAILQDAEMGADRITLTHSFSNTFTHAQTHKDTCTSTHCHTATHTHIFTNTYKRIDWDRLSCRTEAHGMRLGWKHEDIGSSPLFDQQNSKWLRMTRIGVWLQFTRSKLRACVRACARACVRAWMCGRA